MKLKDLLKQLQISLQTEGDELARVNGASRNRELDELRYHSGFANGVLYASQQIETLYRRLQHDEEG